MDRLFQDVRFGVRLLLKDRAFTVMAIREGPALLAAGFLAGLAGSLAIGRAMQSQLYGVGPTDPVVAGAVAVVLGLVALAACTIPARRASRIDPLAALAD